MTANPIVHWELMGGDGTAQKDFYAGIFDWNFERPEGFDDYHMVVDDGIGVGGAVGQGMEEMPSYSAMYVQVESIDDTLAQVESSGGTSVIPRTEIPGTVIFGLFKDPAGNLVGLVEED